jgi:pyruvate dehydrogenase E1 component alpha subunit
MPRKEVGKYSISSLSILDEEGNVDEALDPKLGDEECLFLYRNMWLAREADQRMLNLQRQGRIGTFGPATGQEACVCAPVLAMTEKDWTVHAFRELGAQLMRGLPLSHVLLFYNGYEEGNVTPEKGRSLPLSIIVGAQCLHAAGIGYAMQYREEKDSAVVVWFGDGATSEGDFHEAMNFAGVWKAPVVFFCQNNQWAISLPRGKQTRSETLAQKAIAYEMPGIQVDGNDALAVYSATKEALERAHGGEGPTLIEAITYRLMMHTTADDPKKYRTEEEVQEWWKREPLQRFRMYLEKRGIWDAAKQEAMEAEVKAEVDGAVQEFEAATDFQPDASFDHVFGTRHESIEAQRAEFLENLKKEKTDA